MEVTFDNSEFSFDNFLSYAYIQETELAAWRKVRRLQYTHKKSGYFVT